MKNGGQQLQWRRLNQDPAHAHGRHCTQRALRACHQLLSTGGSSAACLCTAHARDPPLEAHLCRLGAAAAPLSPLAGVWQARGRVAHDGCE